MGRVALHPEASGPGSGSGSAGMSDVRTGWRDVHIFVIANIFVSALLEESGGEFLG